jgi:hypothetical protein
MNHPFLPAAYHFYGEDLFADFYLALRRVTRLLSLIGGLVDNSAHSAAPAAPTDKVFV